MGWVLAWLQFLPLHRFWGKDRSLAQAEELAVVDSADLWMLV